MSDIPTLYVCCVPSCDDEDSDDREYVEATDAEILAQPLVEILRAEVARLRSHAEAMATDRCSGCPYACPPDDACPVAVYRRTYHA
jgi:hypothetical protein